MFKHSHTTHLEAWRSLERADQLPSPAFPVFVGTGHLGLGLDASGLQALPESLGEQFGCPALPFHRTQADLYLLAEGVLSAHLWDDEEAATGAAADPTLVPPETRRNFLPLGWLDQSIHYEGTALTPGTLAPRTGPCEVTGADFGREARNWRRLWDLRQAFVRTSFELGFRNRLPFAIEVFAPHGGHRFYLRLLRGAAPIAGDVRWQISLRLQTRHGLPIFDQPGAVQVTGPHTLTATIDEDSRHRPIQPYTVLYAVAADGADLALSPEGWALTLTGPANQAREAWVACEVRPLWGEQLADQVDRAATQAEAFALFDRGGWDLARQEHLMATEDFWNRSAEIGVETPTTEDLTRAWLFHLSLFMLRHANDYTLGGTVQFLLLHQNGWRACNFHDHHYIVDALARANLWEEARGQLEWLHSIMRDEGRPFPWMVTSDGFAPVPEERDQAPMSDANRALLAIRIFELEGQDAEELLADDVYPIVRRVAEHACETWFYQDDQGRWQFRPVENDVMEQTPRTSEAGTVAMYLTVLRKAVAYAEALDRDLQERERWRAICDGWIWPRTADGRYSAWHGAPDDQQATVWFALAPYVAEAHAYLDHDSLRRTRDAAHAETICNRVWINAAGASAEIRLGSPDRAEQFLVDSYQHGTHGPGWFEEVGPHGRSSLPPFASAHGSWVVALCEQLVLPDFWEPRLYIGYGLPSRYRGRRVYFSDLRGLKGLLLSGAYTPHSWDLEFYADTDIDLELVIRLPAAIGLRWDLIVDQQAHPWTRDGEFLRVNLNFEAESLTVLQLDGSPAGLLPGTNIGGPLNS